MGLPPFRKIVTAIVIFLTITLSNDANAKNITYSTVNYDNIFGL